MIPDFVHYADAPASYSFLLPAGRHVCDLAEIERKLVEPFNTSATRKPIFEGLSRYLNDCKMNGISGRIWLDGSFVTGKNDPGDVDVVSLVSADLLRRLNPVNQDFALQNLNAGEATKQKYQVHSFAVVSVQKSHADYVQQAQKITQWVQFFSNTKEFIAKNGKIMQRPKGILQLDFGEGAAMADVAQWFESIGKEVTL